MSTPSNYHMSLAFFILNEFELNENFYACPVNSTDSLSASENERVGRPILGAYFFTSGCIYVTLYSLCVFSMLISGHATHPAYKIMLSLSLFDIPSVLVNSQATGIMGYYGIKFCEYPRLIFFLGANGFGLWLGCSICCISLAVCRIGEINPDLNINWIFKGVWMQFLLLSFFLAPFYGVFFTKPVIFRPEFMSWFFDPGLGLDASNYTNLNQPINNAILTVITLLLYFYLVYFLLKKGNGINSADFSRAQRSTILQAAIICFFHSITSFLYVYMQFLPSPEWLIVVAQIGWQTCTGSASVIYLVLNRSIRRVAFRIICPKGYKVDNRVSYISDSTV